MKAKLKHLLQLYGRLGVGIYVGLCLLTFGASFVLLRAGLQDVLPAALIRYLPAEGTTWIGAYALYKGLQLPRIAVALAITPVIARWLGRVPTTEAA